MVRSIAAARPDLVFYAGFLPAGARLLQQLRAAGLSAPFMAGDALRSDAFVQQAGAAAEGAYLCDARPLEGDGYAEFARRYRERWGDDPGPFSAQAFDAMTALLRALDRTAERHGDALLLDRRDLLDTLMDTDFKSGASGRIRFYPNGDRQKVAHLVVFQVRERRFEQVYEDKVR
jgi:branched-chain amino acid transport system substrate-binding protein